MIGVVVEDDSVAYAVYRRRPDAAHHDEDGPADVELTRLVRRGGRWGMLSRWGGPYTSLITLTDETNGLAPPPTNAHRP